MVELADIVRAVGPAYVTTHAGDLLPSQRRALTDIVQCRTATLGGSLYRCADCGALDYRYHSCRNRHCPKCQADRAQQWLERVQARLLPCDHYLVTFTLPAQLRALARRHQRVGYGALLREAAASVQAVAEDRAWIGGTPGILAVLHTWSRTLDSHPPVHLLVTAGGLTTDRAAWIRPAHARFLLPGYVLSQLFRAKMRDALTHAGVGAGIDARLWRRRWTVHVERIGSGDHATLYLSRYVYRVALTNRRLERFADGRVTFQYTHARTHTTRALTLSVDDFLTRFLHHVLPRGFTKVRWYGLLSASRRADLERARDLLTRHRPPAEDAAPSTTRAAEPSTRQEPAAGAVQPSTSRCAVCSHGHWVLVQRYPPSRAPPSGSCAAESAFHAPASRPPRGLLSRAASRRARRGCLTVMAGARDARTCSGAGRRASSRHGARHRRTVPFRSNSKGSPSRVSRRIEFNRRFLSAASRGKNLYCVRRRDASGRWSRPGLSGDASD